jgi:hypothetical protein
MMDGYGYMSSTDWLGMALLLALWTLLVIGTTAWALGARRHQTRQGADQTDGGT